MRKNIYDILRTAEIDLRREYDRLYKQFYNEPINTSYKSYRSIADLIAYNFVLLDKQLIGRCISVEDFNDSHDFYFIENPLEIDIELLISFAEYILTFCLGLIFSHILTIDKLKQLPKNVISCMEDLGYQRIRKENCIIFVEKNPAAIAAAEIIESELSYSILEYNHHRLKGQLTKKRTILKHMADNIEPKRKELKSINEKFTSKLFWLLNKFIRHDISENEQIKKMTDDKLESVYDDIYQMWLLAILLLDNAERSKRIDDLIEYINK